MQRSEELQISSLMDNSISVSSVMRLKRCKQNLKNRIDFLESQQPKKRNPFPVKAIIFAIFPSAYYLVGR